MSSLTQAMSAVWSLSEPNIVGIVQSVENDPEGTFDRQKAPDNAGASVA
jgi:hypothetical protein